MAMTDLLKEAIADAKAVRETAMANAKAALSEAFAPKLQSMLNATLQNEIEGGDEGEIEDVNFSDVDFETGDGGEDLNFGSDQGEMAPEGDILPDEPTVTDVKNTDVPSPYTYGDDLDSDDEYSYENIVAEFDKPEDPVDDEPNLQEDKKSYQKGHGAGKPVAGSKVVKKLNEDDVEPSNEAEEGINLQELIDELSQFQAEGDGGGEPTDVQLQELKSQLREHRNVIKFLKSRLNEVNLLNAKLLFTNKLFKKHNMNESQKLRVIETLDRASTLKECKLVYSTLEETYVGMKQATKPSVKKIVESIASKRIESTRPQNPVEDTVINEGADLVARFQKLAGIKKNK